MRGRAVVVGFAGFVVVSVLTTPAATAAQQQTDALTDAQISRALLILSDLPAGGGFTAVPANATGTPPASETGGICNGPNLYALAQKARSSASGSANFLNSNTDGPYVSEVVFAFPSVAGAKQFTKPAKKQVAQCTKSWSTSTSPDPADPPTEWTIALRPIAKIGDERFASRMTGTGGGDDLTRDPDLPRIIDTATVRVGNHVVLVSRYGISEVIGEGRAEVEGLTKKAVAHLEQALLFNQKSG